MHPIAALLPLPPACVLMICVLMICVLMMFVGAAVCSVTDDVDGIRHGQAGIVLQLSAAGWVTVQFQNDGTEARNAFAAPLVRTVKTNSVRAIGDTALAASVSDFHRVLVNVLL